MWLTVCVYPFMSSAIMFSCICLLFGACYPERAVLPHQLSIIPIKPALKSFRKPIQFQNWAPFEVI